MLVISASHHSCVFVFLFLFFSDTTDNVPLYRYFYVHWPSFLPRWRRIHANLSKYYKRIMLPSFLAFGKWKGPLVTARATWIIPMNALHGPIPTCLRMDQSVRPRRLPFGPLYWDVYCWRPRCCNLLDTCFDSIGNGVVVPRRQRQRHPVKAAHFWYAWHRVQPCVPPCAHYSLTYWDPICAVATL